MAWVEVFATTLKKKGRVLEGSHPMPAVHPHPGEEGPPLAGQARLFTLGNSPPHPLLRMLTNLVGNTNASRGQRSCRMKSLGSMPRFWNMAGNEGDPVYKCLFDKTVEKKN